MLVTGRHAGRLDVLLNVVFWSGAAMAITGLVLAMVTNGVFGAHAIDLVNDLTLLAMVGIVDPPRAEAKDAIAKCHSAGIQVRMITGDHAVTAAAIGHELGIEGTALTGAEFAAMEDAELLKRLPNIGVVARVAPEDKIRLVTLLQAQQNIVAACSAQFGAALR